MSFKSKLDSLSDRVTHVFGTFLSKQSAETDRERATREQADHAIGRKIPETASS